MSPAIPKPARRKPKPRKRIRTRRPLGTVRREAKAAGEIDPLSWAEVIRFYGGKCAYCELCEWDQQDHIVPISRGGKHVIGNVAPSCHRCNYTKGMSASWKPNRKHPFMEPR